MKCLRKTGSSRLTGCFWNEPSLPKLGYFIFESFDSSNVFLLLFFDFAFFRSFLLVSGLDESTNVTGSVESGGSADAVLPCD